MNQKFAKFTSIVFTVFTVLFILLSLLMLAISIYAFVFTAICAISCFLVSRTIKKKYVLQNKCVEKNQFIKTPYPKTSIQLPEGEMNYNLFEDFVDKNTLVYEYEENICLNENAIYNIQGKGGSKIAFVSEPENPYDSSAISILLDGEKIGYVYRGKIQDMINDWLKRNEFFTGYINKYSIANNKATYKIGFYKPIDIYENKRFALTKISKKTDEFSLSSRYENFCDCDDGDIVLIEKGYEDNYIVATEFADEIGELPKSAISFIETGKAPKKIVGILDGCDSENECEDEITPKPHITVYLIR